ncbi:hypothetical protein B0J14DRAFT_690801 [Halenospora varia]|nr:hypothetical protein B0J14DRAFT_690801 [Halenospora varia]
MCGCPDFDSAVVHIAKRVIEFITYWFPSLPLGAKMQLFHFKKESLTKLKAIAEKSSEARLSTNDALSAFMWRCVNRVPQTGVVEMPVATSKFLSTADFAKGLIRHYQPTTSEMQFNVWLLQCQYRLCLKLLRISWLQQLPRSKKGLIQLTPISFELQSNLKIFRGNDIFTTSRGNFYTSVDALDLGVRKFRRAHYPGRPSYDSGYIVMPAYGIRDQELEDAKSYPGGLEVLLDSRKPHIEALMADHEWCQYVSWAGRLKERRCNLSISVYVRRGFGLI